MINFGRIQRLCSFIILFFFFFHLWAGMVLFCLKRFLFSSLDSIQDASTVVFVLDNTKI